MSKKLTAEQKETINNFIDKITEKLNSVRTLTTVEELKDKLDYFSEDEELEKLFDSVDDIIES